MKNNFRVFIFVVVSCLSICSSAYGEIRVGLAETDITPPIGGLTAGYSSAQPTDGVHDRVVAPYRKSRPSRLGDEALFSPLELLFDGLAGR